MKKQSSRKGFTLIELLVVIAIIAILSVVVILTLNPAELLRQSRDSNRISDFATLKSAISLFNADVTTSTPNVLGGASTVYLSGQPSGGAVIANYASASGTSPAYGYLTADATILSSSTSRVITGTGWIPIPFTAISSGAPIGTEPVDPLNNATNSVYTYLASGSTFKMAVRMESAKYGYLGSNDVVTNDGGNSTNTYEQGTNIGL
jgi:prepilin-type N-terminal cleavage/methylation domain-containing protein